MAQQSTTNLTRFCDHNFLGNRLRTWCRPQLPWVLTLSAAAMLAIPACGQNPTQHTWTQPTSQITPVNKIPVPVTTKLPVPVTVKSVKLTVPVTEDSPQKDAKNEANLSLAEQKMQAELTTLLQLRSNLGGGLQSQMSGLFTPEEIEQEFRQQLHALVANGPQPTTQLPNVPSSHQSTLLPTRAHMTDNNQSPDNASNHRAVQSQQTQNRQLTPLNSPVHQQTVSPQLHGTQLQPIETDQTTNQPPTVVHQQNAAQPIPGFSLQLDNQRNMNINDNNAAHSQPGFQPQSDNHQPNWAPGPNSSQPQPRFTPYPENPPMPTIYYHNGTQPQAVVQPNNGTPTQPANYRLNEHGQNQHGQNSNQNQLMYNPPHERNRDSDHHQHPTNQNQAIVNNNVNVLPSFGPFPYPSSSSNGEPSGSPNANSNPRQFVPLNSTNPSPPSPIPYPPTNQNPYHQHPLSPPTPNSQAIVYPPSFTNIQDSVTTNLRSPENLGIPTRVSVSDHLQNASTGAPRQAQSHQNAADFRRIARQLDELAAALEESQNYDSADALRAEAQKIRLRYR